ncbi:MAG: AraC family transcriptional regulator [Lachnospiraceae bacterium]
MQPLYENREENLEIFIKKGSHSPPHLHKSLECIYLTEGSIELGIGQEFFHVEKGDAAIIFPELIHHYQVFNRRGCKMICLFAMPVLGGKFLQTLQISCPENPVVKGKDLHPDVIYSINSLLESQDKDYDSVISYAFVQIILARCMPRYHLIKKSMIDSDDIVYKVVAYLASRYTEKVTLTDMAKDLGYSSYSLSRVFSGVFHTNFNQYVNKLRLDYVINLLEHTDHSITDIWLNAGFDSQRTFHRVFKNVYHMTPREYRLSKR